MSALVNCLLGAPYLADEEHYLLVCYADGRSVIEPGPALIRFSGWSHARIELLKHERHVASEAQCVTVVYRDGRSERRLGPCVVTRDPFQHERIEVQKLPRYIATADQHMLVQLRSGETLLRRGPLELVMDPLVHEKLSVSAIQRHVADPTQYLVILYRDGRKENLRGPVEVVQNPFVHLSIEVFASHRLSANEALVVYRRRGAFPPGPEGGNGGGGGGEWKKGGPVEATPAGSPFALIALAGDPNGPTPGGSGSQPGALGVERRLVHGPAVFSPNSTEWLHTFSWHGSVKDGKGSKTGYAGDVKVLRCMPDQMYYSVRDVRTSDDASMTVHLMLFYIKWQCYI
ncbi:hypothetical protein T492DRAFT_849062 [Pavlovales sp. CCMP2436]|nr:hypothetical protein T492DRAFT_849062 [Pavlovales sp. CCMP2436]